MRQEILVSVDVEADGPIPGDYSMVSLGAAVVGATDKNFYMELCPISDRFVPEALAISGLSRIKLLGEGVSPRQGMMLLDQWIKAVCEGGKPIFVGFNATFDWMFVHWYFIHFLGKDPFGISGWDIKAYYAGKADCEKWAETSKRNMKKERPGLLAGMKHTHNALDDAIEQAELFKRLKA